MSLEMLINVSYRRSLINDVTAATWSSTISIHLSITAGLKCKSRTSASMTMTTFLRLITFLSLQSHSYIYRFEFDFLNLIRQRVYGGTITSKLQLGRIRAPIHFESLTITWVWHWQWHCSCHWGGHTNSSSTRPGKC